MSVINEIIPEQAFEQVLVQIGCILLDEFETQITKQSVDPGLGVFIERTAPYDKSEDVVINVNLEAINYDEHTESDSQGETIYNVDLMVSSLGTELESGDKKSQIKLHRYMGWIRYILQSHKYKTVGLPLGFIGGTYVKNIQFDDNYGEQAAGNVRMARCIFSVRVLENQKLWDTKPLLTNTTQYKLDQTELGHKLIKNF